MNCNEMFNAGICYVTDAYKTVCKFNEELHADLEKYRDENAKLREQNRYLMKGDLLHVLTDQELAEQQRREREMQASIKALDAENVKLRELVWELFHCSRQVGCDCCETIYRRNCGVLDRIRELGIEVD